MSNDAELFKGGIHLGMLGLTAMCFGYALMTYSQHRQTHSLVNSIVYGALAVYELKQIYHHLSRVYLN